MDLVLRNFGLMTLIMMGIVFFYFRHQGMLGTVLVKTAVLYTVESVVVSLIVIMAFTWFWNRAIAVEEAS
ncbi:MAG: hypothetical protein Q7R76_03815 [Candidatus Woesearchaeota archaeon]|nr:hypothetical protein [Candidatus Woesearchaeota archaeon]